MVKNGINKEAFGEEAYLKKLMNKIKKARRDSWLFMLFAFK